MRYTTLSLSLAFILGCTGLVDTIRGQLSGAPDGFACPDGTTQAGGSWPEGETRWQSIERLAPVLDGELQRWREVDEDLQTVHMEMAEGDEHWWCERADGSRQGPYLSRHVLTASNSRLPEGSVLQLEGSFSSGLPDGNWVAAALIADAPPLPAFEGRYLHGAPEGSWSWYCTGECGHELYLKASFEDAQPHGTWTWSASDEEIQASYAYGVLEGPYQHRWADMITVGSFTNGERTGRWQTGPVDAVSPVEPPPDEATDDEDAAEPEPPSSQRPDSQYPSRRKGGARFKLKAKAKRGGGGR